MQKLKALLLALAMFAVSAQAADVKLAWDANATIDNVTEYIVYQSSTLTGPFLPVGRTAGTSLTLLDITPGVYFWYVTAVTSGFWGILESSPSNIVSTPTPGNKPAPVGKLIILLVK